MDHYLHEIEKLWETIPTIAPMAMETPVVIYGAGNSGREALRILREKGYSVLGFLDRSAKSTFEEIPCVLPDSECARKWCNQNATVIIAVMNPHADSQEINRALAHFSWNRIVPFPQFVELFHNQWGDHFWITHRDFYKNGDTQKVLFETAAHWKDQTSRDCFRTILKARLNARMDGLDDFVRANHQQQYFPKDIPGWTLPINFVDCGAFDGDTLRGIPTEKLQSVAAFEPDMENFQALISTAKSAAQFEEKEIKVLLWPCGVWCKTTMLNFNGELDGASHIGSNGNSKIPVVALDEVLHGFRPNFIKMDIEGAELEALRGAHSLIRKYHPALAICAYHKPEDLWEIVRLIDSWDCDYKFSLRAHQYSGLDVVLYATAKNSS